MKINDSEDGKLLTLSCPHFIDRNHCTLQQGEAGKIKVSFEADNLASEFPEQTLLLFS